MSHGCEEYDSGKGGREKLKLTLSHSNAARQILFTQPYFLVSACTCMFITLPVPVLK